MADPLQEAAAAYVAASWRVDHADRELAILRRATEPWLVERDDALTELGKTRSNLHRVAFQTVRDKGLASDQVAE